MLTIARQSIRLINNFVTLAFAYNPTVYGFCHFSEEVTSSVAAKNCVDSSRPTPVPI